MSCAQVLLLVAAQAAQPVASGLPLIGEKAEEFLRTAEVGKLVVFEDKAVTQPMRTTLTDGDLTLRAVFKTVDTTHSKWKYGHGRTLFRVKDSYKHEIASYELDKLLGLGMVPPTAYRKIHRRTGSLCLWIEGAMTEWERARVKKVTPPDSQAWNHQMYTVRLFIQLLDDPDFNNARNLLVDADFKIYKIDASMAFRTGKKLRNENALTKFSRRVLEALEHLDRAQLDDRLGQWLDTKQIDALWARRTRILKLAAERTAKEGEAAVLFP